MNKEKIETIVVGVTKPLIPTNRTWIPGWINKIEHFIRVSVCGQPTYLLGQWTVDAVEELYAQHGLDIEEELARILTEEIEKEIKNNGSHTWAELCAMEAKKQNDNR